MNNNNQSLLSRYAVDALMIEDPSSIFYLTGCKISAGMVLLFEKETVLFVDSRYFEEVKKINPHTTALLSEKGVKQALQDHLKKEAKIGFDSSKVSFAGYQKNKMKVEEYGFQFIPCDRPLKEIQMIKTPKEIFAMKKAAKITWDGFLHSVKLLKEGVTEKEIALSFEIYCKEKGAEKLSFDPIIAFGKNSAIPHHSPDGSKLERGMVVLMDLGVVYEGYCSDMTRCVFFGEKDPNLEEFYTIVRSAQKEALIHCKPGMKVGDLDKIVRNVFQKHGVEEFYLHSLGHGVGVDIHEYPRIRFDNEDKDLLLEEGMTITIEPGLYLEGVGGIRYEDTILITSSGYENFYPESNGESL